jgi:hypothetical protein
MRDDSAADLLEALSSWVQEQMAAFPLRDSAQHETLMLAALKSQIHAVEIFEASASLDAGLEAGRKAFKRQVVSSFFANKQPTAHVAPISRGPVGAELWVEPDAGGSATAAG